MQELWLLRSARRLVLIDIYMKFREETFERFSSYRADTSVTDGQTDRRTHRRPGKKTICLPPLKWGDMMTNVNTRNSVFEKKCKHQLVQHRN